MQNQPANAGGWSVSGAAITVCVELAQGLTKHPCSSNSTSDSYTHLTLIAAS